MLEFESFIKIFFADQGSKADALAALGYVREWAHEREVENIAIAQGYLAGTGPFPERAAVLAVTGRFLTDFADMVGAWADWATTVVEDWPEDPKDAQPIWQVFEDIASRGNLSDTKTAGQKP